MHQTDTGVLIAQLRKERNLTQKQLADQLHISDRTISKWERGAGFPDVSLLEPLADALGCSVVSLLEGRLVEEPAEPDVRSALRLIARETKAALRRDWGRRFGALFCLLIVGFVIFGILDYNGAFLEKVERSYTAGIWQDGEKVGETAVVISGERTRLSWLRKYDMQYAGQFAIEAAPETCRQDTKAEITWREKTADASVWYYSELPSVSEVNAKVDYWLYCDRDMNWFALTLKDGRIIACDEGWAQLQALRPHTYPVYVK